MRLTFLVIVCQLVVSAYNNPPYEVYPYVADPTDDPPLSYTKVCDPGAVGEANASYVVLGIDFPIFRQAVAPAYSGDLVIPAVIDGLPVRKIMPYAFSTCQNLRSVHVPASVREVGDYAFYWCTALTNVTFEEGVTFVGDCAFTNCLSLGEVRFPKSLERLGRGCFAKCDSLADIHFQGNAPLLECVSSGCAYFGEKNYNSASPYSRARLHIFSDTIGWRGVGRTGVPERWPMVLGYSESYQVITEAREVPSVQPGFVTVVTEVEGCAVAVPESWAERYPSYVSKFGTNFSKSLCQPTGKIDAAGRSMFVWQDYVSGTDPTDVNDRFVAVITMDGDEPKIDTKPVLSQAEKDRRVYTIYGRSSLWSGEWLPVEKSDLRNYNFFKVSVRMK